MSFTATAFDWVVRAAATPSPSPTPFDEDTVTPGWVGFSVTFLIGVVTIVLIFDMVRRLRRLRYRGEIREQLEAEQAAAAAAKPADSDSQ